MVKTHWNRSVVPVIVCGSKCFSHWKSNTHLISVDEPGGQFRRMFRMELKGMYIIQGSFFYSCETQLLTTMYDLLSIRDSGSQTDVIVLDFSKAFDKVPHRRLLNKLRLYGVSGPILPAVDWHVSIRTIPECDSRRLLLLQDGSKIRSTTGNCSWPALIFVIHKRPTNSIGSLY